ncbi:hypothetical protein M413DRAFT_440842 [Hebeloma cylindrosporum]|uniref:Cytochrome P450 n=1 Tax=Hebeloma cylindrosporum TaxID=76867 RepID=A0A0C3CNZ1_HEBCY|nr:hypothetical protein M413DRAFT_440842 [Hebeloma cylindrosporum h7]
MSLSMDGVLKATGCFFLFCWSYSFLKGLQAVNYAAGYRPMFSPITLVGAMLPMTWWNLGLNWTWKHRKTAYFNQKYDIISMVPWLHGQPSYYTGSLEVAQQLLSNEGRLNKPRKLSSPFLLWGENVFSANHDDWKRHRRILAPAFNTKTYAMVLEQTRNIYRDMVESEGWEGKSAITIDSAAGLTLRTAFLVIVRCGFGMSLKWVTDDEENVGDTNVGHALKVVLDTTILRLLLPSWMYQLPIQKLRTIDQTWRSFAKFMRKSVQSRYEELAGNPQLLDTSDDVFTRLVSAIDGEGKNKLDMDEVIGNTFVLMFAGHETTAVTLAATLAYLALYPNEQQKAHSEIVSIISHRDPTLEDLPKLTHTLACFQEALRLYPAGQTLTRETAEDIHVKVSNPSASTMVLPKGSLMMIDMIGIHRNPRAFPVPDEFRPSRWYGISDPDVTMFGIGPRACIGRKFSQTEALTFLSLFLREWKVEPALQNGETFAQYEERVMSKAGHVGLSFGITKPIGLVLKRRA